MTAKKPPFTPTLGEKVMITAKQKGIKGITAIVTAIYPTEDAVEVLLDTSWRGTRQLRMSYTEIKPNA